MSHIFTVTILVNQPVNHICVISWSFHLCAFDLIKAIVEFPTVVWQPVNNYVFFLKLVWNLKTVNLSPSSSSSSSSLPTVHCLLFLLWRIIFQARGNGKIQNGVNLRIVRGGNLENRRLPLWAGGKIRAGDMPENKDALEALTRAHSR